LFSAGKQVSKGACERLCHPSEHPSSPYNVLNLVVVVLEQSGIMTGVLKVQKLLAYKINSAILATVYSRQKRVRSR